MRPVVAHLLREALAPHHRCATRSGPAHERLAVFLETLGAFLQLVANVLQAAEAGWFAQATPAQWRQVWPLIAMRTRGPRVVVEAAALPLRAWLCTSGASVLLGPAWPVVRPRSRRLTVLQTWSPRLSCLLYTYDPAAHLTRGRLA